MAERHARDTTPVKVEWVGPERVIPGRGIWSKGTEGELPRFLAEGFKRQGLLKYKRTAPPTREGEDK